MLLTHWGFFDGEFVFPDDVGSPPTSVLKKAHIAPPLRAFDGRFAAQPETPVWGPRANVGGGSFRHRNIP